MNKESDTVYFGKRLFITSFSILLLGYGIIDLHQDKPFMMLCTIALPILFIAFLYYTKKMTISIK